MTERGPIDPSAGDDDADATPPPRTGVLAGLLRRYPLPLTAGALGLAFLLLAAGALTAGIAVGSRPQPPAAVEEEEVPPRVLPETVSDPTRLRTCSIAPLAADPRLADFTGQVTDALSGEVLWDRRGTEAVRAAGAMPLLTSAAALTVLGSGYRISTRVVEAGSGAVALVGHGDATLSATAAGVESVYPGAPKLSDLATQTVTAFAARHPGDTIDRVTLDATWWSDADRWDPTWARSAQTGGALSEVTALQVDGDRADPGASVSPRSTDPIGRAGAAFLAALRAADPGGVLADDVAVERGLAPAGQTLGEVRSQAIGTLVPQLLLSGDRTMAEMLARIVSRESGHGGAAVSLQDAITAGIAVYGVPSTGLVVRDGSGLSAENVAPASFLTAFLAKVRSGAQGLSVLRDGLPVSGESGALAARFAAEDATARGAVHAVPGAIAGATTLAGLITAQDGTELAVAFAAVADGVPPDSAAAIDAVAAAVFDCGDNLSAN